MFGMLPRWLITGNTLPPSVYTIPNFVGIDRTIWVYVVESQKIGGTLEPGPLGWGRG